MASEYVTPLIKSNSVELADVVAVPCPVAARSIQSATYMVRCRLPMDEVSVVLGLHHQHVVLAGGQKHLETVNDSSITDLELIVSPRAAPVAENPIDVGDCDLSLQTVTTVDAVCVSDDATCRK